MINLCVIQDYDIFFMGFVQTQSSDKIELKDQISTSIIREYQITASVT